MHGGVDVKDRLPVRMESAETELKNKLNLSIQDASNRKRFFFFFYCIFHTVYDFNFHLEEGYILFYRKIA